MGDPYQKVFCQVLLFFRGRDEALGLLTPLLQHRTGSMFAALFWLGAASWNMWQLSPQLPWRCCRTGLTPLQ